MKYKRQERYLIVRSYFLLSVNTPNLKGSLSKLPHEFKNPPFRGYSYILLTAFSPVKHSLHKYGVLKTSPKV